MGESRMNQWQSQHGLRSPVPVSSVDLVLAVIPLALLAGVAVGLATTIPLTVGIAVGAVVSAGCVGYGIYLVSHRHPDTHDRRDSTVG